MVNGGRADSGRFAARAEGPRGGVRVVKPSPCGSGGSNGGSNGVGRGSGSSGAVRGGAGRSRQVCGHHGHHGHSTPPWVEHGSVCSARSEGATPHAPLPRGR